MKKILIFVLFIISSNYLALCSAEVLTQKPVWAAVEAIPASTSAATVSAQIQISRLPTVHILPDNPLYFLKTLKEKLQLLVTRDAAKQANLLLDFSQKRLAEAAKITEKGKVHIGEKLLAAFGEDIAAAQVKIKEAKQKGEETYNLLVKLQETVAYQKSVIEKLQGEASDYSSEVGERVRALNSFLVKIDQGLGEGEPRARSYMPSATESGKVERQGRGIGDWLRGLFGRKDILKPLVR
jgi:hypothetical protein